MRGGRPLLALAVLLALAGAGLATAGRATAAPEQVYLAVGDSIAAGIATSLPRERGYPWLVRDLIEQANTAAGPPAAVTLVNLAVPGETVDSFLNGDQLQRAVSEIQAAQSRGAEVRAVTVTLGGNDILRLSRLGSDERQVGLDRFRQQFPAALQAVMDALGEPRPRVVVTTYYDLSGGDPSLQGTDSWWLAQFNEVIRRAATDRGASVADLEPAFRGHIQDWTWFPSDIHPNNDGHAEIARIVWQALALDTQPPEVSIERPGAGNLSRRTPTIRVKADDNVGVTRVALLVDGEYVSDLIYVPAEDAYLGVWDARDVAAPAATLTVRASDLAGQQTTADVTVSLPGDAT